MTKKFTLQQREIKKITGFGKPAQIKHVPAIYENGEFYADVPAEWSEDMAANYVSYLNGDAELHSFAMASLAN